MEMRDRSVLLVEDNEDSREIYTTVLRHQGFRVRIAVTGEEALAMALQERPDAVVLDLGLPGMDGVEVARRLRGEASTAAVPILVLTVHAQPHDREGAEEAGCDRYLVKPADPAAVGEEIERMLAGVSRP
jgi:two-component system, cell cycle response regulator DivK